MLCSGMTGRPQTVTQNSTAAYVRELAAQHHVTYVQTQSDLLAQHMTRLADAAVVDHPVAVVVHAIADLGLRHAGHLDRRQLVHLQVKYLREAKP